MVMAMHQKREGCMVMAMHQKREGCMNERMMHDNGGGLEGAREEQRIRGGKRVMHERVSDA
jgi:hypothetical protein